MATDIQTLKAAIRIAYHEKRFHSGREHLQKYFHSLAEMMRSKFPQCPCSACRKKSAKPISV